MRPNKTKEKILNSPDAIAEWQKSKSLPAKFGRAARSKPARAIGKTTKTASYWAIGITFFIAGVAGLIDLEHESFEQDIDTHLSNMTNDLPKLEEGQCYYRNPEKVKKLSYKVMEHGIFTDLMLDLMPFIDGEIKRHDIGTYPFIEGKAECYAIKDDLRLTGEEASDIYNKAAQNIKNSEAYKKALNKIGEKEGIPHTEVLPVATPK